MTKRQASSVAVDTLIYPGEYRSEVIKCSDMSTALVFKIIVALYGQRASVIRMNGCERHANCMAEHP